MTTVLEPPRAVHAPPAAAVSPPPRPLRTLILLAKRPDPALRARIAAGEEPQTEYLTLAETLGADQLDFHAVDRDPVARLVGRLGPSWGLAWLGFARRHRYDVLYATGEDIALRLGILLRAAGARRRLVAVIHNAGTPKRRALLRRLGPDLFRHVICLSQEQRRVLVEECGLPADRVTKLDYWCDDRFYRPEPRPLGDYALSVGLESRDYATLEAAVAGLPYRFHVVASGWSPGSGFTPAAGPRDSKDAAGGSNITVGRGYSTVSLRELYAGSRFVIVPLKHVTYAAGITAIVEAMAMGKPVIVSDSPGIADWVKDGVSGRLVPTGDSAALRDAIVQLWERPDVLAAIGRHNRRWIETDINHARYAARVRELLSWPSS